MAESNYKCTQCFEAGEDLSLLQNYFVKLNSDSEVITTDAGEAAIGVNTGNAEEGENTGVMCESGSKIPIVAGAAITAGVLLASDADGKAITAVDPAYVMGIALETAAADEDLITMLFQPQGKTILDT